MPLREHCLARLPGITQPVLSGVQLVLFQMHHARVVHGDGESKTGIARADAKNRDGFVEVAARFVERATGSEGIREVVQGDANTLVGVAEDHPSPLQQIEQLRLRFFCTPEVVENFCAIAQAGERIGVVRRSDLLQVDQRTVVRIEPLLETL